MEDSKKCEEDLSSSKDCEEGLSSRKEEDKGQKTDISIESENDDDYDDDAVYSHLSGDEESDGKDEDDDDFWDNWDMVAEEDDGKVQELT